MNMDRFVSSVLLVISLSGCAATKPMWPVSPVVSKPGHIESRKSADQVSLFFREPNTPLTDNDNMTAFIKSHQMLKVAGLLNSMSLESLFESSLSSSIGKEVVDQTQKIRLHELEYNTKLASIKGKDDPMKNLGRSQIVSYIQKRSISQKYLEEESPRLVVAYGVSSDLSRIGVSAELFSLYKSAKGETIRCSSFFDVSSVLDLPNQVKPSTSVADLARNFHIVREAYQQAGVALGSLISRHLSSNDVYFQPLNNSESDRVEYSNYMTFDKRLFQKATALVSENTAVYMYRQLPSHESCGDSYLTAQATQSTLDSMAEVVKAEIRKLKVAGNRAITNERFVREQGLRNQQTLYKRLGLNNKH